MLLNQARRPFNCMLWGLEFWVNQKYDNCHKTRSWPLAKLCGN